MNIEETICIIAFDAIDQILYYSFNNKAYQMLVNKTVLQNPVFRTTLTINDLHFLATEKHSTKGVLITANTIKNTIPKYVGEYFHHEIWVKDEIRK
jgi:hypothetical protein